MGAEKFKNEFKEKDDADDIKPKKYGYGVRHVQMLCLFFIMTSLFIARASMAVAVLAMSDDTKHNESHSNDTSNNDTDFEDTGVMTYDWDKKTQSLILSSFFWGYVLMQIPSGILSKKIGGKTIILISLIANCAICATLPTFAALGGWKMVCASRVMMGLTQSCLFPASHTLLGQWLPDSERTSYTGMVYGGAQLGTVIAMPVSGFLADTAMGWKLIFYVNSGLLFITTLLWHYLAANTPKDHRSISQEERDYIEATLNVSEKRIPLTPWKHILRSGPVLVLMAPEFGFVLCFVLFFVDMPTYMEKGLQISLKNSAILSALPYIGMWVGSMFSSFLSEWILNKSLLSLTTSRKIFQSIALYGTAAGLILLSFLGPEEKWLAVVALIALMTISGFSSAGFLVCQLDLSPNYAGVIMSLLNFVANIGSVLMPIATSYILRNDSSDVSRWRWVFLIMATICAITGTIFVLFGTSERQKWDDPKFLLKESADPEEMNPVLTNKDGMEVKKNESPEK